MWHARWQQRKEANRQQRSSGHSNGLKARCLQACNAASEQRRPVVAKIFTVDVVPGRGGFLLRVKVPGLMFSMAPHSQPAFNAQPSRCRALQGGGRSEQWHARRDLDCRDRCGHNRQLLGHLGQGNARFHRNRPEEDWTNRKDVFQSHRGQTRCQAPQRRRTTDPCPAVAAA